MDAADLTSTYAEPLGDLSLRHFAAKGENFEYVALVEFGLTVSLAAAVRAMDQLVGLVFRFRRPP